MKLQNILMLKANIFYILVVPNIDVEAFTKESLGCIILELFFSGRI